MKVRGQLEEAMVTAGLTLLCLLALGKPGKEPRTGRESTEEDRLPKRASTRFLRYLKQDLWQFQLSICQVRFSGCHWDVLGQQKTGEWRCDLR